MSLARQRIVAYLKAVERRAEGVLKPQRLKRLLRSLRFHDDGTPHGRRTLNGVRLVKWPVNGSCP